VAEVRPWYGEAHRLVDAVPEDRLADAVEMLRQWASPEPGGIPRRRFRTTAIFDGEPDLGTRAKQIVRDALAGRDPRGGEQDADDTQDGGWIPEIVPWHEAEEGHGQRVGESQQHGIDMKEVTGQDAGRLSSHELPPTSATPAPAVPPAPAPGSSANHEGAPTVIRRT
jgi:hypothetical protein